MDRDGQLQERLEQHQRLRTEHDHLLEQVLADRSQIEQHQAELEELRNQLRFAQAELEGMQARDKAASGFSSDELTSLRQRLQDQEQSARTHDIESAGAA